MFKIHGLLYLEQRICWENLITYVILIEAKIFFAE